ncbi:hypothetical protein F5148DRAFT_1148834 [Russula earlei]|uniref:Uncharacterized protein n=1 Tax=Russula earlei TaxID=71964 RepID=A0ACC0UAN4_9AGAM|nr:hypothetical protein F5148DRAFT_1148834 [Russula earlei]
MCPVAHTLGPLCLYPTFTYMDTVECLLVYPSIIIINCINTCPKFPLHDLISESEPLPPTQLNSFALLQPLKDVHKHKGILALHPLAPSQVHSSELPTSVNAHHPFWEQTFAWFPNFSMLFEFFLLFHSNANPLPPFFLTLADSCTHWHTHSVVLLGISSLSTHFENGGSLGDGKKANKSYWEDVHAVMVLLTNTLASATAPLIEAVECKCLHTENLTPSTSHSCSSSGSLSVALPLQQDKSCVSSLHNGNTTTVSTSTTHHNLLYNTDLPVLRAYERLGHDVVAPKSQFEMEWDAFEHNVLGPLWQPVATITTMGNGANGVATTTADLQEMYAHTMITMEPKLVPRVSCWKMAWTVGQEGRGVVGGVAWMGEPAGHETGS